MPRIVETTTVKMTIETVTKSADQDDNTPQGSIVIAPLPSCPVTPLNVYPANKTRKGDVIKPSDTV